MTTNDDSTAAIGILEEFQLTQYGNLGIAPPPPLNSVEEALAQFDQLDLSRHRSAFQTDDVRKGLREAIIRGMILPGSRFDRPLFRDLCDSVGRELEAGLVKPLKIRPIFGESPLLSPNAMVCFLESGGHIVVLQRGLLQFFTAACKALAHSCPLAAPFNKCSYESLSGFLKVSSISENIYYRAFPWFMEATLVAITAKPPKAREIVSTICNEKLGASFLTHQLSESEENTASILVDSIFSYVLAHEYGHIVTDSVPSIPFGQFPGADADDSRAISRSYLEEQMADDLAVGLSLRRNAKKGYGPEVSYLGVSLFFELGRFLQNAIAILCEGKIKAEDEISSPTHPPIGSRLHYALGRVEINNGRDEDTGRGQAIARSFRDILDSYWILMEPLLEEWNRRGLNSYIAPEYRISCRPEWKGWTVKLS